MNKDSNQVPFSEEEYDEAEQEAMAVDSSVYVHTFKTPFEYQGKKLKELAFDFEKLTGRDSLDVENELQRKGITVIVPTFSGDYLIRIAVRACTTEIGCDALEQMKISDYNKIRSKARSFLLSSEL